MTRFKELKRIEAALQLRDVAELQWALGYCRLRIQIATRKDHTKHWRLLENKVKTALAALEKKQPVTSTIFIRLLDEGIDVWKPVEANQIDADIFEIVSDNPNPEDEKREFTRGQRVRCTEKVSQDGDVILVAVAVAKN